MIKSYKFKIEPTKQQIDLIIEIFGQCRFVYNHFLDKGINLWKSEKKSLSKFDCCKELTQIKKNFPWLYNGDAVALQCSLDNLQDAYIRFFKHQCGFPQFKEKHSFNQSYTTKATNNNIRLEGKFIKIPKLGLVRIKLSKQIEGIIKKINISKSKTNKYYVSLCCEVPEIQPLESTGSLLGIDLGIKDFLIDSNGNKIENPHYYIKSQRRRIRLSRLMHRKPKGSKNREKSRIQLSQLEEHVANQRNDFHHKITKQLVEENDIICCESLKVKNMIQNPKLAKHIQDCGWGSFISKLDYKCKWYGKTLVKIDTFFPSSQLCSNCNYKYKNLTLDIREWVCPECGQMHDRDTNAAKNILKEGLRILNL